MKRLCATTDVPADEGLRIQLSGRPPLAVFRLADQYYVTDDTCTHGNASLCDGYIDSNEGTVECPYHQGSFEIATGRPAGAPCAIPLRVYRSEVRDSAVYAALDQSESS